MRDAGDSASPSSSARMSASIIAGVVVSRGSPGMAWLSSGSMRSSRVRVSPSERANAVSPAGPPKLASSRLPAVLSLSVIAASHKLGQRHAGRADVLFR